MYTYNILRYYCSFLVVIILFIKLSKTIPRRILRILINASIFKRANTSMVSPFTFEVVENTTAGFCYMTCFQANVVKSFEQNDTFSNFRFWNFLHWWNLWFSWLQNRHFLILFWFDAENRAETENIPSFSHAPKPLNLRIQSEYGKIRTGYGDLWIKSTYSVRIGHFLHSVNCGLSFFNQKLKFDKWVFEWIGASNDSIKAFQFAESPLSFFISILGKLTLPECMWSFIELPILIWLEI